MDGELPLCPPLLCASLLWLPVSYRIKLLPEPLHTCLSSFHAPEKAGGPAQDECCPSLGLNSNLVAIEPSLWQVPDFGVVSP